MPNKIPESYIIRGGKTGSDRLKILARATWATSEQFLMLAGISEGMRCLDAGCGNGQISFAMARMVGPSGSVTGIDADEQILNIARETNTDGNPRVVFVKSDLETELPPNFGDFDLIHTRFLLSHLKDPARAVARLVNALAKGGILTLEDVDFSGHFCFPENRAFQRFVTLYEAAGLKKGADPLIGPKLPGMLLEAGLVDVKLNVVLPTFMNGDGKLMAMLTMANIQDAVVAAGLATPKEVAQILSELEIFTRDSRSIMSLPRIFQVSGKRK